MIFSSASIPPSFPAVPRLGRSRRAGAIADELRGLIIDGTLAIGSKLPTETVLCQQFDVSRTTLREAVQMLRSTGMLEVTPGRGSFVRVPNLQLIMPSLQLAGRHKAVKLECVMGMLNGLLSQGLQSLQGQHMRLRESIQGLYQHTLPRNAAPEAATQTEEQWVMQVVYLAEQPLLTFVTQMLLGLSRDQRLQRYKLNGDGSAAIDEILRTTQLQLRVNAALMEGDVGVAQRSLAAWLLPAPKSAGNATGQGTAQAA